MMTQRFAYHASDEGINRVINNHDEPKPKPEVTKEKARSEILRLAAFMGKNQ